MKGYSRRKIFSVQELQFLQEAQSIIQLVPLDDIRCHELVRVVGQLLNLEVADGFYGFVDHSWLWTKPLVTENIMTARLGFPNILDVYSVGSLPQVRLIDCEHPSLPHVGWAYRPSEVRKDIDGVLVSDLVKSLKARESSWRPSA